MSISARRVAFVAVMVLSALVTAGLVGCPGSKKAACGEDGKVCCAGNVCDAPAICVQNTCLGPNPDSGIDAGQCPCSLDGGQDAGPDAGSDAGQCEVFDSSNLTGWCAKSGSWVYDSCGPHLVGSDPNIGQTAPGSWLHIPAGFCAHHFANVANARQIRFAPNGDLFVASPSQGSTGGGPGGLNAIVVVPDDNQDGYGDSVIHFRDNLSATQGMLFANGYFYYQFPDSTPTPTCGNSATPVSASIIREPYTSGQRVSNAADGGTQTREIEILTYCSNLHWPKTLDISDDGTIFVGNGGDQGEQCVQPMPAHGGIWKIDGTADGANVVMGMRNPYAVKCHRDGHNYCFATELSLDYSAAQGGREKLVQIYPGENVGFPCCATEDQPYPNVTPTPDCSGVVSELDSFAIGDTPFGLAFVDAQYPAPWSHTVFVSQHGAAGTWSGARVVGIAINPDTGIPEPGSDVTGVDTGGMVDFATGWDDGTYSHGRPADIEFSSDGRLFISSDTSGEIFWIAPVTTSN